MTEKLEKFKQQLGLLDGTMLVAGSMIGSGIFIVTADIARQVGSSGYLLLTWIITGIVTVIAALSYGELAGMMPKAGGQYVYINRAYNRLTGFLYGWTVFMVIQTGTIAAVAVAFARYTSVFLPSWGENNILFDFGFLKIASSQVVAIALIIFLTAINLIGIQGGRIIQLTFTTAKILGLAGLIVAGIYVGLNYDFFAQNFSNMWDASQLTKDAGGNWVSGSLGGMSLLTAFGLAMVGSLFAADAWNNVTFIAGEMKNPRKNIPLSLALGTFVVMTIYLLANVAYLGLLPLHGDPNGTDVVSRGIQFATNDRVGAAAASQIFGNVAVFIMAALIMVSTFGCNNGLVLAGARVYYAMSKDGLFFKRAGHLNQYGVPQFALIIQAVWASVLCLSGTYGDLLDYATFASLLFYIVTISGIFILRRKEPEAERPYKVWGYPFLPIIYIIVASAICLDWLVFKTTMTGLGLLIVFLGVPVYYFLLNKPQQGTGSSY